MFACAVEKEAPPSFTMWLLTIRLVWQAEQVAAVGVIFKSSKGLTLMLRGRPRRYE